MRLRSAPTAFSPWRSFSFEQSTRNCCLLHCILSNGYSISYFFRFCKRFSDFFFYFYDFCVGFSSLTGTAVARGLAANALFLRLRAMRRRTNRTMTAAITRSTRMPHIESMSQRTNSCKPSTKSRQEDAKCDYMFCPNVILTSSLGVSE